MAKFQRGLFLIALLMVSVFPAFAADFYETQLRLGTEAYRTGRLTEAVDYFKIANFGLMDRPVLLVEGLARLAIVQDAAGLGEELSNTLQRFVAVERQFPSWTSAAVDADLRRQLETLLEQNVPSDLLENVPSLSVSRPAAADPTENLSAKDKRKYWEDKHEAEPSNPRWALLIAQDEVRRGDLRGGLRWTERALEVDPNMADARILRIEIFTAREEYDKAASELLLVPKQFFEQNPRLIADAFVVYTRVNQFSGAEDLYNQIPMELVSRPDVAQAMAEFQAREASRLEAQAMKAVDETELSDDDAAVPEAAPVEGPEEPVEARINAPRGSFTSPADPVAEALSVSRRLIHEGRPADAQLVVRDAIRSEPGSRELRLTMLEASCLASDWRTGVSQLLLIEPFRTGEEKYMFYGSVVYFESGSLAEAKELMEVALPKLARNAYVDHYARRVLGE